MKELEAFALRRRSEVRRQSFCRACQHEYYTQYYREDPDFVVRLRERNKQQRVINRAYIVDYLRKHPCVDCNLADPIVLEFDHVTGEKRAAISTMIRACASLDTIKAEIEKCVVRCANCHRRRTATTWSSGPGTRRQDIDTNASD